MLNKNTLLLLLFQAVNVISHTKSNIDLIPKSSPNIVIFIADDLGIGDVGCYGNDTLRTPNIDSMCNRGLKLNHNLAAESVCTPSRAALLTGRYAVRYGLTSSSLSEKRVIISASSSSGIPSNITNFAELLKTKNYTNGYFGKWHVGLHSDDKDFSYSPLNRGFDYYFGMPLTNLLDCDFAVGSELLPTPMLKFPKTEFFLPFVLAAVVITFSFLFPLRKLLLLMLWLYIALWLLHILNMLLSRQLNCILLKNNELVEQPVRIETLTNKLTIEVESFIEKHQNHPFMAVVSYHKVHAALATSKEFDGQSKHGKYGDNVEEMDASVGRILNTLQRFNLTESTFVYFTSDHGPALYMFVDGELHGGSKGIFKGGKGSSWEGGIRVPTVVMMPGKIPAGIIYDKPTSALDLFPTLLSLAGVSMPSNDIFDGKDISVILEGGNLNKNRCFFHYCGIRLQAVTCAPKYTKHIWKLHYEIQKWDNGTEICDLNICPCFGDRVEVFKTPLLFNLQSDPGENNPLDSSSLDYKEVLSFIAGMVTDHTSMLSPVESQLSAVKNSFSLKRQMCCNYPFCSC